MTPMNLDRAISIAVSCHAGQRDKRGDSYIRHPLRVMEAVRDLGEDAMIVAVLHDVVEDTSMTLEELGRQGCTEAQIMAIDSVTRREGEDYFQFLERTKLSSVGRRVKIADIEDNMSLWRMKNRGEMQEKDLARIKKYMRAWSILQGC